MAYIDPNTDALIARHATVLAARTKAARRGKTKAAGYLNSAKVRTGTSEIVMEPTGTNPPPISMRASGELDVFVALDDTRGQDAAMTIEFGRKPRKGNKGMDGLLVLHRAFHIPPKIGPT